jgi:hypothetical protein
MQQILQALSMPQVPPRAQGLQEDVQEASSHRTTISMGSPVAQDWSGTEAIPDYLRAV